MSPAGALSAIGWPPGMAPPPLADGERLARVIEQHRNAFVIHDGAEPQRAEAPRGLIPDENDQLVRPGVGDWVIAENGAPLTLKRRLPRRNVLRRGAAGEAFKEQVLAANLDLSIVVMGLDGDYSPRRLERYLTLIGSAGISVLVVLSKADRCDDAAERRAAIQALTGETPVLAINCKNPDDVAHVAQRLGPGRTAVLLGSSGAGKSTLTNTLMGEVRQKTSKVREHDSRGRHTTTVRSLLTLPGGGCLIDSPGMRELKLTGEEKLEGDRFADIEELAARCRFSDCRHETEPDCVVRTAIDAGELDPDRLEHYRKLADERDTASAQRLAQERKAEEKTLNRAFNQRLIDKHSRR